MLFSAASDWRALPKVSLHEHLDGGLRPATLLALCQDQGLEPPQKTPEALARWMAENAHSGSLPRYLAGFELTVRAMARAAACERVAFELACDARDEGVMLAEFRMAPHLLEPFGLSAEAATEALLQGLARSGLACGLIVCGMRHMGRDATLRAAQLAARYQHAGVVGFDLAGPERGYPATEHRAAIDCARRAGLGITLHAGEADGGVRVVEAGQLGAQRIGHGVAVVNQNALEAPRWSEQAHAMGLHFEVCPSSNVHTGAAASLAQHPVTAMLNAALSVSCSTDNRLISATTLCEELYALHQHTGVPADTLVQMQAAGMRASFLPEATRAQALAQWQAWVDQHPTLTRVPGYN